MPLFGRKMHMLRSPQPPGSAPGQPLALTEQSGSSWPGMNEGAGRRERGSVPAGREVAVTMRRLKSSPAIRAGALVIGAAMLATLAGLPGAPASARPARAGRAPAGVGAVAPGTNL